MRDAPPPITGPAALLAQAFPALGASDEGRAVAAWVADVGTAILSLTEGLRRG